MRSAAIRVNDAVNDVDRQKLYLLVPRLMGTSKWQDDTLLSVRLAVWCARRVSHLAREKDRAVCEAAIVAAEKYVENPTAAYAAAAYAAADAADAAADAAPRLRSAQRLTGFTDLLDEFDRLTGRTETDLPPVTEAEWQRIAEAVSA